MKTTNDAAVAAAKKKLGQTPVTGFRFSEADLARLDELCVVLGAELGQVVTRPTAIRMAVHRLLEAGKKKGGAK